MRYIKKVVGKIIFSDAVFEMLQKMGVHITPNHFYNPIPDTRVLEKSDVFSKESEMVGIDINAKGQLYLLDQVFPKYKDECKFPLDKTEVPYEYYIGNGAFGLISAAVLHCMVREYKPKKLIEVGSGNSTYVTARAALMNQAEGYAMKVVAIEPYPNKVLQKGFPGLTELVAKKVENVDSSLFSQLQENDILFIDSSHVIRLGGDVNYLYLEVLPRLNKGVIVHIHDIFLPLNYPKEWVVKGRKFWNEQYLLQAFLINNNEFYVLWGGSYMYHKHFEKLKSAFVSPEGLGLRDNYFSSSFWMKKI